MSSNGIGGSSTTSTNSSSGSKTKSQLQLYTMMFELGYASCEPSTLRDLFTHITYSNPLFILKEPDVARALGMMMMSATVGGDSIRSQETGTVSSWDVESFVSVVREINPALNWRLAVRSLDYEEFAPRTVHAVSILVRALRKAMNSDTPGVFYASFPNKEVLEERWTNAAGQLALVRQMLASPPELFSLSLVPGRKIFSSSEDSAVFSPFKATISSLMQQPWNNLDVTDFLIRLFDSEFHDQIRSLLELAARQSPELFCLALASYPGWNGSSLRDTLVKIVCSYLMGHSNCSFVLTKLWLLNPNLVLACMVEVYLKDPTGLSRVLDAAQELRILPLILESKPSAFSLDFACLASRREHVNLEKWLSDQMHLKKDSFTKTCFEFLRDRLRLMLDRSEGKGTAPFIPLTAESIGTFLMVLGSNESASLSAEAAALGKEISSLVRSLHLETIINGGLATLQPSSSEPKGIPVQQPEINFPPDVEDEVNSYYERIYKHEFDVKDIFDLFSTLKSSKVPRDQQIFACMIHNLFDEYQYFHGYPEKELFLTAVIFGILIHYQLIAYVPLGIALRCILDSIKKAPNSKLYKFGVHAIVQFRNRLIEWPQYCNQLLQITHLHTASPDLADFLKQTVGTGRSSVVSGVVVQQHGNASAPVLVPADSSEQLGKASVATPSFTVPSTDSSALSAVVNVSTLQEAISKDLPIDAQPNPQLQERISFLLNNLSPVNLHDRAPELADLLFLKIDHRFISWFASYLVVRRASIEVNFHSLYILLLETLCKVSLSDGASTLPIFQPIIQHTIATCKYLLTAEKTSTSSSDRTLLKNLGCWLGLVTLARNRPVLQKDLCFKTLLLSAYDYDRLIVGIPFTCKVLDQSTKGTVFTSSNPWMAAMLALLCELYHLPELSLTLKFEVELLYKHLNLDLVTHPPSSFLKNRKRPASATGQQSNRPAAASIGACYFPARSPTVSGDDARYLGIPLLSSYLTLAAVPAALRSNASICRLIFTAFDFAIREVATPVVKRSIPIALATTCSLVSRDFDLHAIPIEKILPSARSMLQAIVSNLVLVTCRDPLRNAISLNLMNFLRVPHLESLFSSSAVLQLIEDNSDFCSGLLERAAIEKALADCDAAVKSALETQRSITLPQAIEVTADTVKLVYDDFSRDTRLQRVLSIPLRIPIPHVTVADQEVVLSFLRSFSLDSSPSHAAPATIEPVVSVAPKVQEGENLAQPKESVSSIVSLQRVSEFFKTFLKQISKQISQILDVSPDATLSSVPTTNEIYKLVQSVLDFTAVSSNTDDVALWIVGKIFSLLFDSSQPFFIEVCILLLQSLFSISSRAATDSIHWILYTKNPRRFNVPVVSALLKSGMLSAIELDIQITLQLEESHNSEISQFAIDLCSALFLGSATTTPGIAVWDFCCLVDSLASACEPDTLHRQVISELSNLLEPNSQSQPPFPFSRDQVYSWFSEWQHANFVVTTGIDSQNDRQLEKMAHQLLHQSLGKATQPQFESFFSFCTEAALDSFLQSRKTPTEASMLGVDSLAKLLSAFLTTDLPAGFFCSRRGKFFSVCLECVGIVFYQRSTAASCDFQCPFLRLMEQLISTIFQSASEEEDHSSGECFAVVFSSFLLEMQPINHPHFTFAWIDVLCNSRLLSTLLDAGDHSHWPNYVSLIEALFNFLGRVDQSNGTTGSVNRLYLGCLTLLLVLLHDFSDFIVHHYLDLCNSLPLRYVQFRNLILSAFPRGMRLSDPFSVNLRIEMIPEASTAVPLSSHWKATITPVIALAQDLKEDDLASVTQLIRQHFQQTAANSSNDLSLLLSRMNALVLVCVAQTPSAVFAGGKQSIQRRAVHLQLLASLIKDSDLSAEFRYYFLQSIANHLRFPSKVTAILAKLLIDLFDDLADDQSQQQYREQIVRVLLERLVVNRPHPWGLLVAFVSLVKDSNRSFWNQPFIRMAPEIERLFNFIARSCLRTE